MQNTTETNETTLVQFGIPTDLHAEIKIMAITHRNKSGQKMNLYDLCRMCIEKGFEVIKEQADTLFTKVN